MFYTVSVSNARRIFSQCNKRLRLLFLLNRNRKFLCEFECSVRLTYTTREIIKFFFSGECNLRVFSKLFVIFFLDVFGFTLAARYAVSEVK